MSTNIGSTINFFIVNYEKSYLNNQKLILNCVSDQKL